MKSKHPWRDEVFRQLFSSRRPIRKAVKEVYRISVETTSAVAGDLFAGLFGPRRRRRGKR